MEKYSAGLALLELWSEGSSRLAQAEHAFVKQQEAIKFVTSKELLSLLAPMRSLIVTVEESSSAVCNFPAMVRVLRDRKTVGLVRNEKISLLRWLYECGMFSQEAVDRCIDSRHALPQSVRELFLFFYFVLLTEKLQKDG